MKRGHLITLEGQDGTGKTTLVPELQNRLRASGYKVCIVEEFSDSSLGDYLKDLLRKDKFLRTSGEKPTALSDTLAVVADLYHKDEIRIKPSIEEGKIIIKDRHIDTIFAYQIPIITDVYPKMDRDNLYKWLEIITNKLHKPDLTFLLKIPTDVQIERLIRRGENVSEKDLGLFDKIGATYDERVRDDPSRFIVVNSNTPVQTLAEDMVHFIKVMVSKCT